MIRRKKITKYENKYENKFLQGYLYFIYNSKSERFKEQRGVTFDDNDNEKETRDKEKKKERKK